MLFEQMKAMLALLINDADIKRKNTILQDESYRTQLLAQIEALTPAVLLEEDYRTVSSCTGLMRVNTSEGKITFDPFNEIFNSFAYETSLRSPGKISMRAIYDDQRYLIADTLEGVQIFSKYLEFARTFPHFDPVAATLGPNDYGPPSSAIYFEQGQGSTLRRLIAIAMQANHCVRIFDWDTGVVLGTCGTPDTPGDAPGDLNEPTDIAYDSKDQSLYIANRKGQPGVATGDHGFVDKWNISDPTAPAHVSQLLYFITDGSLNREECFEPSALDFAGGKLWVANGHSSLTERGDQFAAFTVDPFSCKQCYESSSIRDRYKLSSIEQVCLFQRGTNQPWYVFVANSDYGTVEVFDVSTGRHLNTYGFKAITTEDPTTNPRYYGDMGSCDGVQADLQFDPEGSNNSDILFVASDIANNRAIRINRDAYAIESTCVFALRSFDIPLEVQGWAMVGDIPSEDLKVQYRTGITDTWKPLLQVSCVSSISHLQIQVIVNLARGDALQRYDLNKLVIISRQV